MTTFEVYRTASLVLAEESFRHSWDMSDERLIDGAWVAGLCCECGAFVPYGQEVAHVATALAPLIAAMKAEAAATARADALREAADGLPMLGGTERVRAWLRARAATENPS
jgi:hypothetical protein